MRRITLAIVLAVGTLCTDSQTAQAQTTKQGYYYGYYYYWWNGASYTPYSLPTAYYYNYPSIVYVETPPVWFTPPAPAPVIINVNFPPAPVVVPALPAAPAKEWKTVYPKWAKTVLGKQLNDELWLGADRYKLHEGSGVPPLPSKLLPNELFVETYTRDGMTLFDVHHLSGGKGTYKKVSK